MHNLESKILPFETGIYYYDLWWQNLVMSAKIGTATLQFSKTKLEDIPEEAQKVYDGGDIYKTVFKGRIEALLLKTIAEQGTFTSYACIRNNELFPLLSVAETRILMTDIKDIAVYDRANSILTINGSRHELDKQIMRQLKDPTSHVIHLLFRPRKGEGSYTSGYYHNSIGQIKPLVIEFAQCNEFLIGRATVPANTYVIYLDLKLELPYRYDKEKKLFMPSLKEVPTVSHNVLGKMQIRNTGFISV